MNENNVVVVVKINHCCYCKKNYVVVLPVGRDK